VDGEGVRFVRRHERVRFFPLTVALSARRFAPRSPSPSNLLLHKWLSRCHEDNDSFWEPPVEIVHDAGRNHCLPKAGREADYGVVEEGRPSHFLLVLPNLVIFRVYIGHHCSRIEGYRAFDVLLGLGGCERID